MSFYSLSPKVLFERHIYVKNGTSLLLPIENETRVMPSVDTKHTFVESMISLTMTKPP